MEPSQKHPAIASFLDNISGRSGAITSNVCVRPPIGCGKPISKFKDELSAREYTISGLCQECQDKIWG